MTEPESMIEGAASPCKVEVQNVRRDKWLGQARVAASLVALVLAPWGLGTAGSPNLAVWAGLGALLAYFWSAVSLAGTDRGPGERRLVDGSAVIEGDRLLVTAANTVTPLPLSALDGGWTERSDKGHRAVLSFSDGRVVAVEVASEQEASALLSRAGAGAGASAVRMRGYREDVGGRKIAGFFAAFFGLLLLPVIAAVPLLLVAAILTWSLAPLGTLAGMSVGFVPLAAIFRWMWRKVRATWIQIGADGVVLQGAFRKRFFRHEDILRAEATESFGVAQEWSVRIKLRSGRRYMFPAANALEAQAVIDRIQAAKTATQEQERARLLDGLARGGRPVAEWRRALESLVTATGYRSAGRDVEGVMRIVEDVTAPLEQRVAAALAARPHGGDEAKKRIRIAAEACVEPRVRVALEKASAGDLGDEALEEIGTSEAVAAASGAASDVSAPARRS